MLSDIRFALSRKNSTGSTSLHIEKLELREMLFATSLHQDIIAQEETRESNGLGFLKDSITSFETPDELLSNNEDS